MHKDAAGGIVSKYLTLSSLTFGPVVHQAHLEQVPVLRLHEREEPILLF